MRSILFAALICLIPVLSCAFPAKIIRAVDGDTLQVASLLDGQVSRVRLYGVDSPETQQGFGAEAKESARAFEGVEVELAAYDTDKYGRTVAVLELSDGSTIQEHLLSAGAAWVYTPYCKKFMCLQWQGLEYQARMSGVGLWKDADPTPPWKWRKAHQAN